MANAHKRKSWITRIKIGEAWITEEREIKENITLHFKR